MKKIILLLVGIGLAATLFSQEAFILAKATGQNCKKCLEQGPGWTCRDTTLTVRFLDCNSDRCVKRVAYLICVPPKDGLKQKQIVNWEPVIDSLRHELERESTLNKKGGEKDTCCSPIINLTVPPPVINFPEQKIVSPQDTGWRGVRISPFLEGTTLRFHEAPLIGELHPFAGLEVSLTGYRARTRDKNSGALIKSGWEPEIGMRFAVGKVDQDLSTSCDTCWFWGSNEKSLGFRGILFAQIRWVAPTDLGKQPKNQLYWYLGPRIVAFERLDGVTKIPALEGLLLQGGIGFKFANFANLELNSFYSASQRFGFGVDFKIYLLTFY